MAPFNETLARALAEWSIAEWIETERLAERARRAVVVVASELELQVRDVGVLFSADE